MGLRHYTAFSLYWSLFASLSVAFGEPLVVTTTGDSITSASLGYTPYLPAQLEATGTDAAVNNLGLSGMQVAMYMGLWPYGGDGLQEDRRPEVLATDPDAIVFMLGTNDATREDNWWMPIYYDPIFDSYQDYVNGRGENPTLFVMTITPRSDFPDREAEIENCMNPWLRQDTVQRGIRLLDIYNLMVVDSKWANDYLCQDGLHPNENGKEFIAQEVAYAIYASLHPGDASGDGKVNDADYTCWADRFGTCDPRVDFSGDGIVDDADYTLWADNYGHGAMGTVPEPATLSVLAFGAMAALQRRRVA